MKEPLAMAKKASWKTNDTRSSMGIEMTTKTRKTGLESIKAERITEATHIITNIRTRALGKTDMDCVPLARAVTQVAQEEMAGWALKPAKRALNR